MRVRGGGNYIDLMVEEKQATESVADSAWEITWDGILFQSLMVLGTKLNLCTSVLACGMWNSCL